MRPLPCAAVGAAICRPRADTIRPYEENRGADALGRQNSSSPRRKCGKHIRRLAANRKPQCAELSEQTSLERAFVKKSAASRNCGEAKVSFSPRQRILWLGNGRQVSCRFFWADFRPYRVAALGNTKVFPAAVSLSEQKSAPKKLLCTSQRAGFESFFVRRKQPC